MKFGVSIYPYYTFRNLASIVDFVRLAERLGYDYITIPDHTAFPKEHESSMGDVWWDSSVLAAHLASVTKTIRFAFSILVLPQHNPFYLAKEIATLDHISGGRISVGVGAGWLEAEFALLGVDFHRRGALMDEYIKVLRALWTRDPAEFHGKYLSFADVSFSPKPIQHPHPPILVGGGLKVSVPRAAELGDGWDPFGVTYEEFKQGLARLKNLLADRGRSLEAFTIVRRLPYFEVGTKIAQHSTQAGGGKVGGMQGDPAVALEHIRECETLGVSHMTVQLPTDESRERFAALEQFAGEVLSQTRN